MNNIILLKLDKLKSKKNGEFYNYGVFYDTVLNYKFNCFIKNPDEFSPLLFKSCSDKFVLGLDIRQNCLCYKLK